MAYQAVSFAGFGSGLNLRDKVDAVSETEAIDLLNVRFTERGAVVQRDGFDNFTTVALTNPVASLEPFYTTGGTKQLVAGCGTRLEALNTSGGVVASLITQTDGTWDFVRFGAPGSELIYAGQGNTTLRKWDGTTWTNGVANTPAAGALAVMAVEEGNRLVAGRFNTTTGGPTGGAATSNPSRVYFSDPGAPETWGANNFVDFTPGDGEKVQAIVVWREFVFIFKETKFFIVYGVAEDATGAPIFLWRTVDTGIGLASPRAVISHRNGIYFMGRQGIYHTDGGDPELLSSVVDPIFIGGASDFYLGGVLAHGSITNCAAGTVGEQLYFAFPTTSTNNRVLVYDPRYEWWSLYDIPASCFASFRIGDKEELVFGYASGGNHVGRHSSTFTNDDTVAITSRWRSGWFDYELPEVKTIRETKVWGSGKVQLGVSNDFLQGVGALNLLDLTDPAVDTWDGTTWGGGTWAQEAGLIAALRRRAIRGTTFSTYFENRTLDQSWAVHRLQHHLRETRVPSIKKAA